MTVVPFVQNKKDNNKSIEILTHLLCNICIMHHLYISPISPRNRNTTGTVPAAWHASYLCDWFLSLPVSALTLCCSQSPRQPQLLRSNDSQLFDRLHACHWICVRNLTFVPSLISQSRHNCSLHSKCNLVMDNMRDFNVWECLRRGEVRLHFVVGLHKIYSSPWYISILKNVTFCTEAHLSLVLSETSTSRSNPWPRRDLMVSL